MDKSVGVGGLGVGLDINLRITGLRSTVDELSSALQETSEKTTATVTNLVKKLRDEGVGELKNALQQGKEAAGGSEVYNKIVSTLQNAAARGEGEARKLLNDLGEKVESGGQKMQEVADKEPETRH
jgi:DNA-binding MurR/RpiR family transcriptional regulator